MEMSRPKMSPQSGFTLAELLIAMAIFALIATTMAAMTRTAFQRQSGALNDTLLANNATMTGNALRKALATASYVKAPGSGGGTWLTAFNNVNPIDGSQMLTTDRTFNHFCSKDQNHFYLYSGLVTDIGDPTNWASPYISPCDGSARKGATPILVAGGMTGLTVAPKFSGPPAGSNLLTIQYTLTFTPADPNKPVLMSSATSYVSLP